LFHTTSRWSRSVDPCVSLMRTGISARASTRKFRRRNPLKNWTWRARGPENPSGAWRPLEKPYSHRLAATAAARQIQATPSASHAKKRPDVMLEGLAVPNRNSAGETIARLCAAARPRSPFETSITPHSHLHHPGALRYSAKPRSARSLRQHPRCVNSRTRET